MVARVKEGPGSREGSSRTASSGSAWELAGGGSMEEGDGTGCPLPARRKRARTESREDDAGGEGDTRPAAEEPAEGARRARHLALLAEKSAADRGLEELVFGDTEEGEGLLRRLQGRPSALHDEVVSGNLLEEESCESETDDETDNFPLSKKPAWVDEDDEAEEAIDMTHRYRKNMMKSDAERKLTKEKLQRRLQDEFQSAMGATPSWAQRSMKKKNRKTKHEDDSEEDEDADMLCKTGNYVTTSESLPRGILQVKKCLHANNDRLSEVKLTTVQFHHSAQVVMTAGVDQSVSLFQVDGKTNPKIQSIYLEGFPVYKARFSADGEQVIATSIREKLFYIYDMMGGKVIPVNHIRGLEEKFVRKFEVSPDGSFLLISGLSGYQHLISMKTKEFIGSMKINGRAIASSFSPDGSKVYTHSDDGEVFIWDVKSRRCLNRFTDEGCLHGTSIAVSKNGQYVACGSRSGVVNVYAHDDCLRKHNPKPLKAIMNLVTAVTSLSFNPTSEILAIASKKIDDAVKLKYSFTCAYCFHMQEPIPSVFRHLAFLSHVHIPSLTVFSNFPLFGKKVIYLPQSMDFSPRSGFFSIANNKGKALLYRLQHYSDF